jgi:signal transduction histidine kinase
MELHPPAPGERLDLPTEEPATIDPGELRTLLSCLSHELCRPLASLRAGFDLLLHDPVVKDQRTHLQTMMSLCDDLLGLTRGYLEYAGMVNKARSPSLGIFTLGAIVGEIDRQYRPLAEARGLAWHAAALDPGAKVLTDASLCQQILGNLAANALKYTPPGGAGRVEAGAGPDGWTVTVSDNGPGIPADALGRVFDPFFRLPRDEHSRIEGNGLGLSICRELTGRLGGVISLDSASGAGTLARVWFPGASRDVEPARTTAAGQAQPPTSSRAADAGTAPPRKPGGSKA